MFTSPQTEETPARIRHVRYFSALWSPILGADSTVLLPSRWERERKLLQRAKQQHTPCLHELFRQHDFNHPKSVLFYLPVHGRSSNWKQRLVFISPERFSSVGSEVISFSLSPSVEMCCDIGTTRHRASWKLFEWSLLSLLLLFLVSSEVKQSWL